MLSLSTAWPCCGMIQAESPLGHHLFQVPIAERIAQIPTKAEDDDLVLKVSPAKQYRPLVLHSFTLPDRAQRVCDRSRSSLCRVFVRPQPSFQIRLGFHCLTPFVCSESSSRANRKHAEQHSSRCPETIVWRGDQGPGTRGWNRATTGAAAASDYPKR